jgi:prevent-host-death family protein
MPVTNIHAAKTNLSRLVEAALRGEEVVLARNGKPVVKLVPLADVTSAKSAYERLAGLCGDCKFIEREPDWWRPDDEMSALFDEGPVFPGGPRK